MLGGRTNRRAFIATLSSAAAWPVVARAQQPTKVARIGFLGVATSAAWSAWVAAFVQRLRELGWTEGRNIAIDYRWSDGNNDRLAELAGDLAQRKVDIVVTGGPVRVSAATRAMPTTPIVFALMADPIGTGTIESLARPGGNVTGMSMQLIETVGKRLELIREVVPNLHRLAVMANVGFADALLDVTEIQQLAKPLDVEVVTLEIRRAVDIASALQIVQTHPMQALYVCADPLVFSNRERINALAQAERLPTMLGHRAYVEAGGLMSYGPNIVEMFRRTADFVDKILRGAKPADLPVEQPTKFDFIVNLKTAKTLGLELPAAVLARADEVIE
jgi:putative ABC transport system substrate-binding protein